MKIFAGLFFYVFFFAHGVDSACPSNFVKLGDSCYHFSAERSTWYDADSKCRKMGALLLSIDSKEEEFYIKLHMRHDYKDTRMWTSGIADRGKYIWHSTGKPILYGTWCPGEPNNANFNEHCVELWEFGGRSCLNDNRCDDDGSKIKSKISFICEYNK